MKLIVKWLLSAAALLLLTTLYGGVAVSGFGSALIAALVIGLIISIFQAATQINEQTLSFIPKLVGMFLILLLAGPWMLEIMVDYVRRLFESIPLLIG